MLWALPMPALARRWQDEADDAGGPQLTYAKQRAKEKTRKALAR